MIEKTTMKVERYRDNDNEPTCAINFETGDVCIFYGTRSFGCLETCWFSDQSDKKWRSLQRRGKGVGTLIPLKDCPVWKENV